MSPPQDEAYYRALYPDEDSGVTAQQAMTVDRRKKAVLDLIEFIQNTQAEGSRIDVKDEVGSFAQDVEAMRKRGVPEADVQAFITDALIAAGENVGRDLIAEGITPDQIEIKGRNQVQRVRGFIQDVSTIYLGGHIQPQNTPVEKQMGATPLTPILEVTEGYAKRLVEEGQYTYEDYRHWKRQVEAATGMRTHGDADRSVIEWLSAQTAAWVTGKSKNLETERGLPKSFREYLRAALNYVRSVLRQAARLKALERKGLLPADMKTFMDRAVGLDEKYLMERFRQEEERQAMDLDPSESLLPTVKRLGGIPTPEADPAFRGELKTLREHFGEKRWRTLARRKAKTLD